MRIDALIAVALVAVPAAARADSIFIDPCFEDHLRGFPCASKPGDEPDPAPAAIRERLVPEHLWDLGAGDGTWITAARRALGASTDPFTPGPAFGGSSALENRWTLDGLPVDAVADGAPEVRIPLVFLDWVDVHSGGLPASARASTGAVIDGRLRGGPSERHDNDHVGLYLWLGQAGDVRNPREVADTFDPFVLDPVPMFGFTVAATAGAQLPGRWPWKIWWFAGVAFDEERDHAKRISRRLRDDDGDGRYDRGDDGLLLHDTVDVDDVGKFVGQTPAMLRVGFQRGNHDAAFTGLGAAFIDTRRTASGTLAAAEVDRSAWVGDVMADWTWTPGDRTELRLQAGWHRAHRYESGAAGVQIGTAYVPDPDDLPEEPAIAEACAGDAGGLAPCPLSRGYFVRGGAGLLTNTRSDRPTIAAELARRFGWKGKHRAALGATMEDARLRVHRRFTGGALERRLAEDIVLTSRFADVGEGPDTCDGAPCRLLASDVRTYRTRSIAAYLEDAWRPARDVTLQAGLRWESMEVGRAIRFRDQLAPRLGFSADPTGDGRARVFGSWGRYFPLLPAGMGPAVLGAADIVTTLESGFGTTESIRSGDAIDVDDALEPAMMDELVTGAEYTIAERLHVGLIYRSRWLRRGIEDIGGDVVNPPELRRDAREWLAWFGNDPRGDVHVRVGWARTRVEGSWAGPHDAEHGTTLHLSPYEGDANAHGPLPLDTPHKLFIETIVRKSFGLQWNLRIGARFQIASGMPVGAFGGSQGEVPLLPRGSMGRTPTTSAVIVHAGLVHWEGMSIGLDLVDVFHRRAPAAVDQRWTTDDVRPIDGGAPEDLLWLRTIDGERARPNAAYGVATRYHPPISARLSLTLPY